MIPRLAGVTVGMPADVPGPAAPATDVAGPLICVTYATAGAASLQ